MQNTKSEGKLTLPINLKTPSLLSNMVVAALFSGVASLQQGQGRWSEFMGRWMEPNGGQTWKKPVGVCKRGDWGGGHLPVRQ